jgi:two-component system response regulator BaeR
VPDRILIVEDEVKLAGLLRDYLVQDGFEVSVLHRGDEVEPWMRAHEVDLVLLDLMLPGKTGLEVCKALRAATDVAIIIVTARRRDRPALGSSWAPTTTSASLQPAPRSSRAQGCPASRETRPARARGSARGRRTLDAAGYRATIAGRDLGLTAVEFQLKVLVDHPAASTTAISS